MAGCCDRQWSLWRLNQWTKRQAMQRPNKQLNGSNGLKQTPAAPLISQI
jgi:hypothetical protein